MYVGSYMAIHHFGVRKARGGVVTVADIPSGPRLKGTCLCLAPLDVIVLGNISSMWITLNF